MTDRNDGELRARFRALASAERSGAPPFALPEFRRSPRTGAGQLARAAAVVVTVAAGAAVWSIVRDREVPYPIDLSAVSWPAPTDFLLDTPGAALLRQLPTIDAGPGESAGVPRNTDDSTERIRI